MTTNIDDLVNRFLSWRLPDDFAPDCGISFEPVAYKGNGKPLPVLGWPVGTNLLTAAQARAMLEHVLAERNKADPVTRLHNLCDALEEEKESSPYSAEAWDLQQDAYAEKCRELKDAVAYADQLKADAMRYRALRHRLAAAEIVGGNGYPVFVLPLFLDRYAADHDLFHGSVAGHFDAALDAYRKTLPETAIPEGNCSDIPLDTLIGIWSMRPQPGTPTGDAWERGARQGYEWGRASVPSQGGAQ
jgi:hypothetical protein